MNSKGMLPTFKSSMISEKFWIGKGIDAVSINGIGAAESPVWFNSSLVSLKEITSRSKSNWKPTSRHSQTIEGGKQSFRRVKVYDRILVIQKIQCNDRPLPSRSSWPLAWNTSSVSIKSFHKRKPLFKLSARWFCWSHQLYKKYQKEKPHFTLWNGQWSPKSKAWN